MLADDVLGSDAAKDMYRRADTDCMLTDPVTKHMSLGKFVSLLATSTWSLDQLLDSIVKKREMGRRRLAGRDQGTNCGKHNGSGSKREKKWWKTVIQHIAETTMQVTRNRQDPRIWSPRYLAGHPGDAYWLIDGRAVPTPSLQSRQAENGFSVTNYRCLE